MNLPKLKKISDSVDINESLKKKKKILLLSDDLRMHSGVATVSRDIVLNTVKEYDWIQIAGAIKHPDKGRILDLSSDVVKETGVQDASVKIYPTDGYGNPDLLREIIRIEKPDAILHFTDPRFWGWLYQMEHEIRQTTPLMYYTIWDSLPFPYWNEPFYESCDLLMCISKQTYGIVKNVIRRRPKEDWAVTYVPHGINHTKFFPIKEDHPEYPKLLEYKKSILGKFDLDFILFYNNRNIRRKQPGDIILAYKTFCDSLPIEKAKKCVLLMHTQPVDENGTDLIAVAENLCPDYKILFSDKRLTTEEMNYIYNIVDVTINMASNEGFGLSTAESIMAGTPVIATVTGGLQDQMGFVKEDGSPLTYKDYNSEWCSNHDRKYKKHGPWVQPLYPNNRSLQGSVPTPYIFDDRCTWEDGAKAIQYWYNTSKAQRNEVGLQGRVWMCKPEVGMSAQSMGDNFIHDISNLLQNWKPRKRFEVFTTSDKLKPIKHSAITLTV